MRKIKTLFLVFVFSVFSLTLFACGKNLVKEEPNTKSPDQSWRTEGYKQGDFGNVSKLDANGYAIEDNKIPNKRELPYVKYGWTDRDGTRRYKRVIANAYVETNDYNPLNALRYEIGDTGVPYFDIVTLFAANIVHDPVANKPTVEFNAGIKAILENFQKMIKPLQEKGTRVVLDFLPHHQGWGYKNMYGDNLEYFLDRIAEVFDKYGIDGLDIDDEYAEYWKRPSVPTKPDAPSLFVKRFRERFPKKILSVFNYAISFDTNTVKNKIDFAYENYGNGGLTPDWISRKNHSNYSIECNWGLTASSATLQAQKALSSGNGTVMYFNPHFNSPLAGIFSNFSEILYGHQTRDTGIYYKKMLEQ